MDVQLIVARVGRGVSDAQLRQEPAKTDITCRGGKVWWIVVALGEEWIMVALGVGWGGWGWWMAGGSLGEGWIYS